MPPSVTLSSGISLGGFSGGCRRLLTLTGWGRVQGLPPEAVELCLGPGRSLGRACSSVASLDCAVSLGL